MRKKRQYQSWWKGSKYTTIIQKAFEIVVYACEKWGKGARSKKERKYIQKKEPLSDVYFLLWEKHRRIELIYQSKLGKFLILQMTFVVALYFRFDCFCFITLLSIVCVLLTASILVQLNWKRVSSQIILYMLVTSYSMLFFWYELLFLRFDCTNWDHFSCLFIFHYFLSLVYSISFCWKIMCFFGYLQQKSVCEPLLLVFIVVVWMFQAIYSELYFQMNFHRN